MGRRSATADPLCDPRTREVLDWPALCERLATLTHSDRATAWARELVPETAFGEVRKAVAETSEMRTLISERFSLQRVVETKELVETAARGAVIGGSDLRTIANGVAAANAAVRRVRELDAGERLRERCAGFIPLPALVDRIDNAVGERGDILDRASEALMRMRRGIASAQAEARDRTVAIARSGRHRQMLQDDVVTVREGRFVVPVKAEFAGEFKGIVHDSSASGHTLFVEPLEALESNNRLRALRVQEEHEVARILAELSALVGTHAAQLEINAEIYARLDLAYAKARLAEITRAEPAAFDLSASLTIVDGRHPLLDERAIPQSLKLDEQTRLLLISGPNMGGKTVTLKMAGLYVLMTYSGMHLPAGAGTTVGRFERLFADIGDDQSIAQNASTFSAHLRRMAEILRGIGPRTLILIDEIGSGTEPAAGAALAVALLEAFLESGSRTIATTHASEIKLFGHETAGVQNASVRFDPRTHAPTYQLDLGAPGQSLAFPLARAMGVAPQVVERAEQVLSSGERDYDRALAEVAEVRAAASFERDEAVRERGRLTELETKLRADREQHDAERRRFARDAENRLSETLRSFARELEQRWGDRGRPKVTGGQTTALSRVIGDLHQDLGLRPAQREPVPAVGTIAVGDRVFVRTLEQDGTVAEIGDGFAVVQIGSMRMQVKKADLAPAGAPKTPPRRESAAGAVTAEIASRAMLEIDVRGKRFVEAEPLVEQWLDEAALLGHSPIRLIHGKGTGLLGRGLQQYLKGHAGVRSIRYGNENEGGSGVTIVELR